MQPAEISTRLSRGSRVCYAMIYDVSYGAKVSRKKESYSNEESLLIFSPLLLLLFAPFCFLLFDH